MIPNSENNILINSKILLDLFPFHFIFDSNLIIRQAGSSIKHILGLKEGDLVSDYLELKTPQSPLTTSAIKENLKHLFIFIAKKDGLVFRGQVIFLDNHNVFAFLGSPVLKTQEDLKTFNLNPSHFPLHDNLLDFLVLFQSHKISLNEAKSVTERLLKSHDELKAAKSDLEDYSKRFKAILDNVIDGIITFDKSGLIEFFSESAGRIFGYQAHEVIGKNVNILMPEPYHSENDGYIKNYTQPKVPKSIGYVRELEGLRKDGSIFPMELAISQIQGDGRLSFAGIVRDISERVTREQEMTRSAQEIAQLIDTANAPIFGIDTDGNINVWNQKVAEITGFNKDEVIGENFVNTLIGHKYGDSVHSVLDKALNGKETSNYEVPMFTKEGKRLHLLLNASTRRDVQGDITGVIGCGHDITDLDSLRRQNRLILNAAGEGIYGLDLDGNTTFCNPAAAHMVGYTIEEMIGKPQHSLIHHSRTDGSPYPREECHIYAAFKDGAIHHVTDEVFWRKDGSNFPIEYVSTPIIEEGQITGAVVVFQDISERKNMEKLLVKKTRAAQIANKAKSEFLANTSHEIRTPLNAITGFSKILLKKLKNNQIDEKFEEFLNLIIKSGDNLSEVINNVLDISKIESGKMQINRIGFDLKIVIKSMIAIFKYQALEKEIHLNYYFDNQIKNHVFSDRVKINQILTNLLANAIKFTESGGVIILDVKKSNDLLLFSVTDTGIGIKTENLETIFNEFNQVDSSSTRSHSGSGLGLSICKLLVELLGGNISVESREGKGSRFTVTLPFEEIEAIKDKEDLMDGLAFSKENKVLLVEDNKENMLLAKTILNDLGIEPETAENGESAIEKAIKISPDLIFMDVQMPVMDGLEATKRLRKNPQTKSIPIIGMSAHALSEHEREGRIAGFTDYLTKPIDSQKFSKVCLKYLKPVSQDQDG